MPDLLRGQSATADGLAATGQTGRGKLVLFDRAMQGVPLELRAAST
jgi:hypothetical protein